MQKSLLEGLMGSSCIQAPIIEALVVQPCQVGSVLFSCRVGKLTASSATRKTERHNKVKLERKRKKEKKGIRTQVGPVVAWQRGYINTRWSSA